MPLALRNLQRIMQYDDFAYHKNATLHAHLRAHAIEPFLIQRRINIRYSVSRQGPKQTIEGEILLLSISHDY